VEGKLLVMLISFVWMKICYFRLVCSFVFSIYLTELKSKTMSLKSEPKQWMDCLLSYTLILHFCFRVASDPYII
jgi:hypothetical protein